MLVEETPDAISKDQIPSRLLARAIKDSFLCFLLTSKDWWPVQHEESGSEMDTFIYRHSLPTYDTELSGNSKIMGIHFGRSCLAAEGHCELRFLVESYAQKQGDPAIVSCLPKFAKGWAVGSPHEFKASQMFPTWNSMQEYWLAKHGYILTNSTLCLDVQIANRGPFTYPLECVLPGLVKYGQLCTFVDRPILLPLVKNILRRSILSSSPTWNTAFYTQSAQIPAPIKSLNIVRQMAPILDVVNQMQKDAAENQDDWCHDLNIDFCSDSNSKIEQNQHPVEPAPNTASKAGSRRKAKAKAQAPEPSSTKATKKTQSRGKKSQK